MKTVGPLKWEGGWVSLKGKELSYEHSDSAIHKQGFGHAKQPVFDCSETSFFDCKKNVGSTWHFDFGAKQYGPKLQ